jgi:predicted nucleotidyltransferase
MPDAEIGWNIVNLKDELVAIFNMPVDLVSKNSIENSTNPYRKKEILSRYEVIFDQAA